MDAVPSKTDGKGLKSWAPAAMNPNHYRIMIHTHILYIIYICIETLNPLQGISHIVELNILVIVRLLY